MSLLTVKNLTQGFTEKNLYKDAAFELYAGEHVGVVGQNGAGKSTLLNILLGHTIPDTGEIRWQKGTSLGYLDQQASIEAGVTIRDYLKTAFSSLYEAEREMLLCYEKMATEEDGESAARAASLQEQLLQSDFYQIDSEIEKIANGLGLDAIGLDRLVSELSGGQRAKVILAKLLLQDPDVLLLDEPTNFLDKEHVEWFSGYLAALDNTFVVVSHDFAFLQRITDRILDIEFGTIKKYYGGYADFLRQKTFLREDYVRRYNAQQKEIERTEEFIRRNIAGIKTRMAQGRRKQLARMERIAPPGFTEKPSFRFETSENIPSEALKVEALEVGYYYPLLPPLNFSVMGGEKLVITGFNGIGKSTLLKTLVGDIEKLSGKFRFSEIAKVAYYSQDLVWEYPERTPIETFMDAFPKYNIKEARQKLARCGVRAAHAMQPLETLSGGEQSKVKLTLLIEQKGNFLVLDEITNHLDAETKGVLEAAIKAFSGSVILVSHEEKFYQSFADRVFDIAKA